MEHLNAIRAALRSAAPVVAIPVAGHAPICIKAKLFKGALKGVTVDRVEVLPNRVLMVTGRAGYVRTCTKFAPMERVIALRMIGEWAIKEKAKALKIINQGVLSAKEQKAMKLKKAEDAGLAPLREAEKDIALIYGEAKAHINPVLIPMAADERYSLVQEYSQFHTNRTNRKRGAVIRWKLKTLKEQIAKLVKLDGPRNHKRTVIRKKTDTLKYAALLYQVGQLKAQYQALYPKVWRENEYIGNGGYWEDSWQAKRPSDQAYCLLSKYKYEHFDRTSLVKQLTNALADRRALTPPDDELEVAA